MTRFIIILITLVFLSCGKNPCDKDTKFLKTAEFLIDESEYVFINKPRDVQPIGTRWLVVTAEGGLLEYDEQWNFTKTLEPFTDSFYQHCINLINSVSPKSVNTDSSALQLLKQVGAKCNAMQLFFDETDSTLYLQFDVVGITTMTHGEYGEGNAIIGYQFVAEWNPGEKRQLMNSKLLPYTDYLEKKGLIMNASKAFIVNKGDLFANLLCYPYQTGFPKVASFSLTETSDTAIFKKLYFQPTQPKNLEDMYPGELVTVQKFFLSPQDEVLYVNGQSIANLSSGEIVYIDSHSNHILYDAGYMGDQLVGYVLVKDDQQSTTDIFLIDIQSGKTRSLSTEHDLVGFFANGFFYNLVKRDEQVFCEVYTIS